MHKIAALALWMSLAFAAVVAFQVFVSLDEAQPAGTSGSFRVVEVQSATKDDALDSIGAAANASGHNIYKVQPESYGVPQQRTLFAFVGDPEGFEARGGHDYPTFSPGAMETDVRAASDITYEDLRGLYVTDARADEVEQIVGMLGETGIEARNDSLNPVALVLYSAAEGNLFGLLLVMLLALSLAVVYSVGHNRKVYALRALHGYRRLASVIAELKSYTLVFGVGLAGLLVVGVPALGVYNGFSQALGFLRVLATTLAGLYLVTAVLVVVAVLLVSRGSIPKTLKGERASVRDGVLAAGVQVAVLAIVVATTSAAMARVEAIEDTMAEYSRWSDGDPLYTLAQSISTSHEDHASAAPALLEVISSMERAGQVLLVNDNPVYEWDDTPPLGPDGSRSMLVNHAYLDRVAVLDADGERIQDLPDGKDTFTLLVPTSYDGDADALLLDYVEDFADWRCGYGEEGSCDPVGTVVRTRPGQDLFTYNGTSPMPVQMQDRMFIRDPVLAVVSVESELVDPIFYSSFASLDNLLFTEPVVLDEQLQATGIRGLFQSINDAAGAVNDSVAFAQRQLRMDALNLTLGWAVLILSSIVMVAVYCDRRKRPMFVELIHGYPFAGRHWRYVVGAVALSLTGVGIAGIAGGSLAHGRDVLVAAGFVTIQVVVAVAAITIYETRFRADFIKRY